MTIFAACALAAFLAWTFVMFAAVGAWVRAVKDDAFELAVRRMRRMFGAMGVWQLMVAGWLIPMGSPFGVVCCAGVGLSFLIYWSQPWWSPLLLEHQARRAARR